jgi:hypothetical protein
MWPIDNSRGDGDEGDQPAAIARRPMSRNALPCSSKRIAHVELFRPRTIIATFPTGGSPSSASADDDGDANVAAAAEKQRQRRRGGRNGPPLRKYHLLFLVMYLHQLYWICRTVGVPYREFLDKAEREGFEGEWTWCTQSGSGSWDNGRLWRAVGCFSCCYCVAWRGCIHYSSFNIVRNYHVFVIVSPRRLLSSRNHSYLSFPLLVFVVRRIQHTMALRRPLKLNSLARDNKRN